MFDCLASLNDKSRASGKEWRMRDSIFYDVTLAYHKRKKTEKEGNPRCLAVN